MKMFSLIILMSIFLFFPKHIEAHHLPAQSTTLATRGWAASIMQDASGEVSADAMTWASRNQLLRNRFGRFPRTEQVISYTQAQLMIFRLTRGQSPHFLPAQLSKHRDETISQSRFREILNREQNR